MTPEACQMLAGMVGYQVALLGIALKIGVAYFVYKTVDVIFNGRKK